ncbi:protein translocase subunit SecF [Vibrio nitrifigilis]|uniref:Protein-export membrane protein SecF n=1 Tax=Vibrio nitrifigilis TaxID=2789781 RepID=A0ABS0GKU9_9VIBR|nr:protein translocase subunit SecF [Vibrio nitrifigilis]MBF9003099.1 protein translocase subunit SecF [Vibrio nitrifigilis]
MNITMKSRWRYGCSMVSLCLMVMSVVIISVKGLNFGLDFTGGVVNEIRMDKHIEASEIRSHLQQSYGQDVALVSAGEPGRWVIRYQASKAGEVQPDIKHVLMPLTHSLEVLNTSIVGPQVGSELAQQGALALLVTVICIMGYLSFRFEWRLACGALFALVHDVVFVIAFFSLTQMEFNLTVLAAVLAILGYSLNDSIIIADRIRELLMAKPKEPLAQINNVAITATFSRTMVTSGTTLLTVAALWFMGGEPLAGFSIAMFIGILTGTFSSVSVGATLPEFLGLSSRHYLPKPISEDF